MGERFYLSQLNATGDCPGATKTKRSKRVAWTDEKKQEAIELYEKGNPTEENSIEIVEQVAEQLEETVNGVRMILVKAGVYVKKTPATGTKAGAASGSTPRVSKEDSQNALKDAISAAGQEADMDIISKMTGKAAVYFTSVIKAINE